MYFPVIYFRDIDPQWFFYHVI